MTILDWLLVLLYFAGLFGVNGVGRLGAGWSSAPRSSRRTPGRSTWPAPVQLSRPSSFSRRFTRIPHAGRNLHQDRNSLPCGSRGADQPRSLRL